ncbi:MAG: hypothetical protein U9N47_01290 [Thermodesulfobacteriota bacterium]|nr:hypothetical protein [Thermodesulfobacteriota bacterium]
MKVATYQTDPILLDIKANLEDTISKIHHAKRKNAKFYCAVHGLKLEISDSLNIGEKV